MHAEEYGKIEKKGIQIGAGVTKTGLPLLFFASSLPEDVEIVRDESLSVASTSSSALVFDALKDGKDAHSILSSIPGDVAFAFVKADGNAVIARKKGDKREVWSYTPFPGFSRVVDKDGDGNPVVLDVTGDLSSVFSSLWSSLPEYSYLEINLDGGRRTFVR